MVDILLVITMFVGLLVYIYGLRTSFFIHNSSCFFIIDYLNTFDCLGIEHINTSYELIYVYIFFVHGSYE